MKIEITRKERNELLKRLEVICKIIHEGSGTPSRKEAREKISAKLDIDKDRVFLRKCETRTGTMTTICEADIYDIVEQAKRIEPKHIILRNTPKTE